VYTNLVSCQFAIDFDKPIDHCVLMIFLKIRCFFNVFLFMRNILHYLQKLLNIDVRTIFFQSE